MWELSNKGSLKVFGEGQNEKKSFHEVIYNP
jgi:hypothetical protein